MQLSSKEESSLIILKLRNKEADGLLNINITNRVSSLLLTDRFTDRLNCIVAMAQTVFCFHCQGYFFNNLASVGTLGSWGNEERI